MAFKKMFMGVAGLIAVSAVALTTCVQTAGDAYNNEPEEGDNKVEQIVGDAARNAVELTVKGGEEVVKTLIKEGGRLVDKYADSADGSFGGTPEINEQTCRHGSPEVVFSKECLEYMH